MYGMDVLVPSGTNLDKLERFLRSCIKQLLSLPQTVANPAPYILSGILPIEAQLHKKVLILFGNIARLNK